MRTKKPQSPFHREAAIAAKPTETPVRKSEKGYVLLVFVMFSALLVVGLSAIIPQVAFEGQREKEEELLFRGQQYQRAIQLFFRKFGRYPNSLEELERTNGIRFLRKAYLDPMTKENDWRLIHIGPGGSFPDAKNPPTPPANLGALFPAQPGGTGLEASPGMFRSTAQTQSSGRPTGRQNPAQAALGGPFQAASQAIGQAITGQLQSAAPALRPSANPSANPLQQPRAFAQAQQPGTAGEPSLNPSLTSQFPFGVTQSKPPVSPTTSGAFNASSQRSGAQVFGGGGIAGVASQSTEGSIKVFHGYRQHDDWEFIYNFRWDPIGVAALARITGVQAQTQTQSAAQQQSGGQTPTTSPGVRTPQVPQWLGAPRSNPRRPASLSPVFPRPPFPELPSTQQ